MYYLKYFLCAAFLLTAVNVQATDTTLTKSWVNMVVMSTNSMKLDRNSKRIKEAFSPDARITVFIQGTIDEKTLDFNDDEETLTLSPDGFIGFLKKRSKGSRLYMLSRKKIWPTISSDGTKATTHSFLFEGFIGNRQINGYVAEDATVELINGKALITELHWSFGE